MFLSHVHWNDPTRSWCESKEDGRATRTLFIFTGANDPRNVAEAWGERGVVQQQKRLGKNGMSRRQVLEACVATRARLEAGCWCTHSLRRRLRIDGGEGAFLDGWLAVGGDDEVDLSGSVLQLE
jgi:hypothetical protein